MAGASEDEDGRFALANIFWPFGRRAARDLATTIPQRLEPKTFLASERTFLTWLHMAVTVSSIAAALLAFSATSEKSAGAMHRVSRHLVEIIALVLLPLAVFIVAYALVVFAWRNSQIALKQASYIDDRRGPLLLVTMVVAALGSIFVISLVDFVESFSGGGGGAPGPGPSVFIPGFVGAEWRPGTT
jgi:uncharacterized membrane protein YidH (DUF202 family)